MIVQVLTLCRVLHLQLVEIMFVILSLMPWIQMVLHLFIKKHSPICIVVMGGPRIGVGSCAYGLIREENCSIVMSTLLEVSAVGKIPRGLQSILFKYCNKDARFFRLVLLIFVLLSLETLLSRELDVILSSSARSGRKLCIELGVPTLRSGLCSFDGHSLMEFLLNGTSLQQQEMSLIQDRTLPSSPSTLSSPHPKSSSFMKGGMGQPSSRKQLMGGHAVLDNSKGILQNISFVSVSIDHSLQLVYQADSTYTGSNQGSVMSSQPGYLEGYTPVKSLGSTSASYVLIPSPSMRFPPLAALRLPTCLIAESPPLVHLLHSKGSAIPLSTGFVVSKAVPSARKDSRNLSKEERPSVLYVDLIYYYGSTNLNQEKSAKGITKVSGKGLNSDAKDFETEMHLILESLGAELHALSWMTVSPAYLERRTALPFHCDIVLRLRRLLHFADKELSWLPDKARGS